MAEERSTVGVPVWRVRRPEIVPLMRRALGTPFPEAAREGLLTSEISRRLGIPVRGLWLAMQEQQQLEQIAAMLKEEPGLSQRRIAIRLGSSDAHVNRVLSWGRDVVPERPIVRTWHPVARLDRPIVVEAIRMIRSGCTLEELKKEFGVSEWTLRVWATNAGLKITAKQRRPHPLKVVMLKRMGSGVPVKDLVEETGLPQSTLVRWAREAGMHPPGIRILKPRRSLSG